MDWTPIVTALVSIVSALAVYAVKRWVIPYLEEKRIMQAAKVAVEYAEAVYGRYNGDEKLKAALDYVANKLKIDVDNMAVMAAVKAAWKELDLAMYEAGVKEVENG